MKKRFIISALSIIGIFVLLSHGSFYKVQTLKSLILGHKAFSDQSYVHITAKAYTSSDSKEFLQHNLVEWGYQPVQLTIENQSSDSYTISDETVEIESVNPKTVAKVVYKSALPRSIGLKIASLLFWPLTIPSAVDSLKTMDSYSVLKKDLIAKTVKSETVAPYSVFNRVIFIPKESYREEFDIKLENQETLQTTIFHVELPSIDSIPDTEPVLASSETFVENYYLTH